MCSEALLLQIANREAKKGQQQSFSYSLWKADVRFFFIYLIRNLLWILINFFTVNFSLKIRHFLSVYNLVYRRRRLSHGLEGQESVTIDLHIMKTCANTHIYINPFLNGRFYRRIISMTPIKLQILILKMVSNYSSIYTQLTLFLL